MTLKKAILASLERPALDTLARDFHVSQVDDQRRKIEDDALRDALDQCARLTFPVLMGYLRKDALVEICRIVGLPHQGTRRELEQRIIEFQHKPNEE